MQRQQLKTRSVSPLRKSPEIALSQDRSPSFTSTNIETQKGFKIITKTEEKIGSRPAFRFGPMKILDPKLEPNYLPLSSQCFRSGISNFSSYMSKSRDVK